MSSARVWLFRVLVLASAGLLVLSWFTPWWEVMIEELKLYGLGGVTVYPYGIVEEMGAWAVFIAGSELPAWFAPLMWAYLGIVIAGLLFSLWAKDKELKLWKVKLTLPSWTIGIVGFSYIVVLVTAVITIAIQAGSDWNAPLQGTINLQFGDGSTDVITGLRFGYWLAWGAGTSLIVLALLRNKIIGKRDT